MYSNTHIMDMELSAYISGFVCEWNDLKRKIQGYGYCEANMETYRAAQLLLDNQHSDAHKLISQGLIDMYKLNQMMEYNKGLGFTIMSVDFPIIGGFKMFYFKEREEVLDNAIRDYYGIKDISEMRYQTIYEVIDMYTEIKVQTLDDDLYDVICDELDIWEGLDEFMDLGNDVTEKIRGIIDNHRRAMEIELKRAKTKLVASDYFNLEKRRVGQLVDLSARIDRNVELLLQISDN